MDHSRARPAGFRYLDLPTPLAFAHRGGATAETENTSAAFERAVGLGFGYIETDIHATADGVPVVFHDRRLDRLLGQDGRIQDLRWADLTTLRVAGAAAVPRLDDVLTDWPKIRFNLDAKSAKAAPAIVDAVRRTAAQDRVLLASFSDARLAWLRRQMGPGVATSLGVRQAARLWLASRTRRWRPRLPASAVAAQVPVGYRSLGIVDQLFVDYCHRRGLQVHAWTVDDPAEMHRLLDLGVDGLMSDRIDLLRDVYTTRGHWYSN